MHELIEGLTGMEVIADDFVVIGQGQSKDIAIRDHDKNRHSYSNVRSRESGSMQKS